MSGPGSQPLQTQPQPPPKRPHGPRLYHKKSKTGCYRCKGRRVKCDEKRPICGGCSRHLVECVYPTTTAAAAAAAAADDGVRRQRTRAASSRSSGQPRPPSGPLLTSPTVGDGQQRPQPRRGPPSGDDEDIAPPESRERRITEMQLLYHYLMTQARTFRRPFSLASLPVTTTSPAGTAASSPATTATPTTANSSTWTMASGSSSSGGHNNNSNNNNNNPFGSSSSPFGHPTQHLQLGPHHNHHHHPQQQPPGSESTFVWSVETVEMAFESDAILYILLAQSALSSWVEAVAALPAAEAERGAGYGYENVADADCQRWRRLQRQYAAMALREHRRAVAGLSSVEEPEPEREPDGAPGITSPTSSPADYVCMSSLMILSHAFALVQTVPTKPRWTPPLEWLQMGHGAGRVLGVAKGMLRPGRDRMVRFLSTPPRFDRDDIFTEPNRAPLMWLLERPPDSSSSHSPSSSSSSPSSSSSSSTTDELSDPAARAVYERVLSYIGWTERAACSHSAGAGEQLFAVCRRFAAFAVWTPEAFHEYLRARRPRALVVLAYFFALWIPFRDVWMIGAAGLDQVRAIREALPPRWRGRLDPVAARYGIVWE